MLNVVQETQQMLPNTRSNLKFGNTLTHSLMHKPSMVRNVDVARWRGVLRWWESESEKLSGNERRKAAKTFHRNKIVKEPESKKKWINLIWGNRYRHSLGCSVGRRTPGWMCALPAEPGMIMAAEGKMEHSQALHKAPCRKLPSAELYLRNFIAKQIRNTENVLFVTSAGKREEQAWNPQSTR